MITRTYPTVYGNRRPYGNFREERGDGLTVWVSYETPIAFEGNGWPFTVHANLWSTTTARHITTARIHSQTSSNGNPGDWAIGPLGQIWFQEALRTARGGGTIADWFKRMETR